jgi:uncharacterized protein
MADIARPAPSATWRPALASLGGLALVGLVLHLSDPVRAAGVANFSLVFGSLLIEAMPFMLLGAVVSAAIEVFVPATFFERLTRLPQPLQLPVGGLAGFAFPVCECGSVPVARRLVAKGLSPGAAITFMLASPILNPVVVASTVVAYSGRASFWPIVAGRAGLGLVTAMAVGWTVGKRTPAELLRGGEADRVETHVGDGRARAFAAHLAGDFLFMARFLVIGAAVAAALQTFVPQNLVASVADLPVVSLMAMMALAFVLSLCSESDAFVAASFVQFGVGAQLAFLVFGPMVDTKLGVLYSATFSERFFRTVVIVVAAVTLAGTLWMEVLFG